MSDSLGTMLELAKKLKEIDELKEEVSAIKEEVKKLKETIEELSRDKLVSEVLSDHKDDKASLAAELAIEHYKMIPPKRRWS